MTPAAIPIDAARPAPLWRRLAAMLYDLFPLLGLWMLTAGLWAWASGYDARHPHPLARAGLQLLLLAVSAAYFLVSWIRIGQTIGMRAWRLRLVREDGGGLRAGRAFARFLLALLSLAIAGCGFWYAWFDPGQRTLHDRLCGTRMIRL